MDVVGNANSIVAAFHVGTEAIGASEDLTGVIEEGGVRVSTPVMVAIGVYQGNLSPVRCLQSLRRKLIYIRNVIFNAQNAEQELVWKAPICRMERLAKRW